uniref:Uncharacterized protein n=1 Tax=Zea mays TaxID=4577 RepID=B6TSX8_MAIZE|nr:hypothetical protein [Zea mays]
MIERSQVFGWRRSEASATLTMCSTKGGVRGTLYNIAKQRMWHWNLCKVMWCSYLEDGGLIKRHVK